MTGQDRFGYGPSSEGDLNDSLGHDKDSKVRALINDLADSSELLGLKRAPETSTSLLDDGLIRSPEELDAERLPTHQDGTVLIYDRTAEDA